MAIICQFNPSNKLQTLWNQRGRPQQRWGRLFGFLQFRDGCVTVVSGPMSIAKSAPPPLARRKPRAFST